MQGMGLPNPMFFVGVVEDNVDPRNEGRVRVRALSVHGEHSNIDTEDLPWCVCIAGDYDPNYPLPPLNSFVLGMFMDGRAAQHPLIIGLIPSQYAEAMNPTVDGYGVISDKGKDDPMSKGFRPDDYGLHQRSRYARVEEFDRPPDELYFEKVNTNRSRDNKVGTTDKTWDQPGSAYAAKYPYNRVIETAHHVIELDDTPGAERIMIYHGGQGGGSFLQIDSGGTRTDKAVGDRYEVTNETRHESSKHSVVTINGNAHVYVKGHKTEEVEGDYKLHVKGNYELGVGKTTNINSGGLFQARSSVMKLESLNAMTLFGKKEIQMEAETQINIVSSNIKNTALTTWSAYANKAARITTAQDIHFYAMGSINNTAFGLIPTTQTPFSGGAGTPGFNVIALGVQMAAANGSFSGIWNAAAINAGTGLFTTSVMSATVNASVAVNSALGNFTVLGAPLPSGPVSYGAGYIIPVTIPTVGSVPAIIPPGGSLVVPPVPAPGVITGVAFPSGNGKDLAKFASSVISTPFDVLGTISALTEGGYGIEIVQMPEPPAESQPVPGIVQDGYYAKGYSMGYLEADDSADKPLISI